MLVVIGQRDLLGDSYLFIGGGILVILGAKAMVDNVIWGAERFGVPDAVISATVVAFGTSVPEGFTPLSLAAGPTESWRRRGEAGPPAVIDQTPRDQAQRSPSRRSR